MRRAFTLIELIVVIGVLGLILSIFLPSLGEVQHRARRAVAASNLRTHGVQFAAYANDYREQFPIYTNPKEPYSTIRYKDQFFLPEVPYFSGAKLWAVAVADYYGESVFHSSFLSPVRRGSNDLMCAAWYSHSFLAGPDFWYYEQRVGPQQWRSVRVSEVRYPSQKAVLIEWAWDRRRGLESRTLPGLVGVADGSVKSIPVADLLPGYSAGDGHFPGGFYDFSVPGLHTIGGAWGRDLP